MSDESIWYIVKLESGNCHIVSSSEIDETVVREKWGPFASQGEAVARRVGLIRAGKCQPI